MILKINSKWAAGNRQRITRQLIAPFILIILISSCKVGKEYERPALQLPTQFNNVSFADTSSIADIPWQNFFTDTTLQNLIKLGITYNHDLLLAIKRIDVAQERVKQAKLLQLPEFSSQISAQYN